MSVITHLEMFYSTRAAVHIDNSSSCNSPNTELNSVPEKAEIIYQDSPNRLIDASQFEAPQGKGYETARFLVERAMLDPDATVVAQ